MTDAPRLLGVVLCGGQSSRMGRDKACLRNSDGITFLQHAVQRIAPICNDVTVSGNQPVETGYRLIPDPIADRGPVVGVAACLRFAVTNSFVACLFTPVDMPALSTSDLMRLKQVWQTERRLTVVRSGAEVETGDPRLQPLVAVYPVSLLEPIDRLAASADRSLIKWIESQDHATVDLAAAACHNVNTPEDLADGSQVCF